MQYIMPPINSIHRFLTTYRKAYWETLQRKFQKNILEKGHFILCPVLVLNKKNTIINSFIHLLNLSVTHSFIHSHEK